MKGETLANLIQCGVTLLLGIIALAGALFCNASFHFFTAMACFWLAWVFYTDNEYGIVSVREYFNKSVDKYINLTNRLLRRFYRGFSNDLENVRNSLLCVIILSNNPCQKQR